jgi:hypothetical protein
MTVVALVLALAGLRAVAAVVARDGDRAATTGVLGVPRAPLSGVALALFLPAHFWVLGAALRARPRLGEQLRWTEQPAVSRGEVAAHRVCAAARGGGLRGCWLSSSCPGATGRRRWRRSPRRSPSPRDWRSRSPMRHMLVVRTPVSQGDRR